MNRNFAEKFKNAVELPSGLWSRWWFTGGDLRYEAIFNDMKKGIVDAGIVRIEVAKGYLWTDSRENMMSFYYLLKAAKELGLRLDFATGNPYPAAMGFRPLVIDGVTYYDPAEIGYSVESCSPYAMKYAVKDVGAGLENGELLEDVAAFVRRGFMGPAELTPGQNLAPDGEKGEKILGVAAVCLGEDGRTIKASVDMTKTRNLTQKGNQVTMTVSPEELSEMAGGVTGDWKMIVYYTELSDRTNVCYLGCRATRTWIKWFEQCVIDNDRFWTKAGLPKGEVRRLFEEVASGLWEDSLEAIPVGYTGWAWEDEKGAHDIFEAFEKKNGYALTPDKWSALFVHGDGLYNMGGCAADDADFIMDSVLDKQIRHDYIDTLTALYRENHLQVYTDWARSQKHPMDTRVQCAYLYALDQDAAYHSVTIPEYESLNSSDRPDANRAVAGAAHGAGLNLISSETGARSVSFTRETYSMAWYDWLWHINNQFATGINATVLHGIEYLYGRSARVWPGPCMAMPFAGLAEPTGQRMPYWRLMKETISSYIARAQLVMQAGRPQVDAAIYYYYNEIQNDYLDHWLDPSLAKRGYTYEFLGDDSLRLCSSGEGGNVMLPDGAGYRALIIDQWRLGIAGQAPIFGPARKQFAGNGYMPLETARNVEKLARRGVPVVIVGKAPDKAAKASDNRGGENPAGDREIQKIFAEISRLSNVIAVESEAEAPEALGKLGVRPDADFALKYDNSDLYAYHRSVEGMDFYYLFNRSHTIHWKDQVCDPSMLNVAPDHEIRTEIALKGQGIPYILDCWTGRITKVADYRVTEDGRILIPLSLKPSEAVICGIGPEGCFPAEEELLPEKVLMETAVENWRLELSLYKPTDGWLAAPEITSEMKQDSMCSIAMEEIRGISPEADGILQPWCRLEALGEHPERASGIGVYTAELDLPEMDADLRYVLEIEEATELFTVKVNDLPIFFPQTDAFGSRQDITKACRTGKNRLEITVASGLWNAVKYYNGLAHEKNPEIVPQLSEESWIARDGLMGKVTIKTMK